MRGMRVLRITLFSTILVVAAVAQLDQTTKKENMVHDRGQFWPEPKGQSLDQGRIGWQASVPNQTIMLSGILVDAGCANRTDLNLIRSPESLAVAAAAAAPGANPTAAPATGASAAAGNTATQVNSHGISVQDQTLAHEREDIMPHEVPDMRSRMDDPTCAITSATRGYAVLLSNGRLLNLDEGGNTMADQAVQSSPAGRAMFNGNAPGLKPHVTIKGWVDGPRAVVQQLKLT